MTRVRAALGLTAAAVLVSVLARAWVRVGQIEAELSAADAELAYRD